MRAQNSPAAHRWPSCPRLPQGLAFPGGVVRGAGLEEAAWGPGWVAELCLSTPWQALQPPLGHCFSRDACPKRKRV